MWQLRYSQSTRSLGVVQQLRVRLIKRFGSIDLAGWLPGIPLASAQGLRSNGLEVEDALTIKPDSLFHPGRSHFPSAISPVHGKIGSEGTQKKTAGF